MKVLSVYYHGEVNNEPMFVGRLSYLEGQAQFEYDQSFVEKNLLLSPYKLEQHNQLQEADRTPFNGMHGVFSDSLPDGWGLYVMDKHLKSNGVDVTNLTPIERLAYIGDRAMGALSYRPDDGAKLFYSTGEYIDLNEIAKESIELFTGSTDEVLKNLAINGTPSGGARPKVLLGISQEDTIHGAFDLDSKYEHWIAKFPTGETAEHKAEGSIEYIYSLMARAAGIDFPETKLSNGNDDNAYFLIKRFDRLKNNQRVHMHTLAGMVHADFRVPDFEYKKLFIACKQITNSHQEVEELFKRMIFNIVVGNKDDHTKNFSFLMDEAGEWKNSPAYDITYNNGINGQHSMQIGRYGRDIPWDAINNLGKEIGISTRVARRIIDEVISALGIWKSESHNYSIPKNLIADINDHMSKQVDLFK